MPQVVVNAGMQGLEYDRLALHAALASLPADAPITILIHGYKYAPGIAGHCPHATLFAETGRRQTWKLTSWSRHLRLGRDGLVIAFGWNARGSIWSACHRAGVAGRALADLLATIDRPVHMFGHSLGARVALSAMTHAPRGSIGRAVLIAGAELRAGARAAMASPAGRGAQVVNVTSRENLAFDLLLEAALGRRSRAIGGGVPGLDGWTDLRVDHPQTRARLARMGYQIAAPRRRVCHWSLYLRPGLMPLYADVIRGTLPLSRLAPPAVVNTPLLPLAARLSS